MSSCALSSAPTRVHQAGFSSRGPIAVGSSSRRSIPQQHLSPVDCPRAPPPIGPDDPGSVCARGGNPFAALAIPLGRIDPLGHSRSVVQTRGNGGRHRRPRARGTGLLRWPVRPLHPPTSQSRPLLGKSPLRASSSNLPEPLAFCERPPVRPGHETGDTTRPMSDDTLRPQLLESLPLELPPQTSPRIEPHQLPLVGVSPGDGLGLSEGCLLCYESRDGCGLRTSIATAGRSFFPGKRELISIVTTSGRGSRCLLCCRLSQAGEMPGIRSKRVHL